VVLEQRCGLSPIATLNNLRLGKSCTSYGGVIFCKAGRKDIQQLSDLVGKTFMAVDPQSLGGWYAGWRELKEKGIDPQRDFADLLFGGAHDAVVQAVLRGEVDAGCVRTDTLERLSQEGKIRLEQFRVIHDHGGDCPLQPFLHSTRPYPEWPLAKLPHTSDKLAEKVAVALIRMAPDTPAAQSARCAGWTIPRNYQAVHECLKELRIAPYENYGHVTLAAVVRRHWPWLVGAVFLLIVAGVVSVYLTRLNQRLRRVLLKYERELTERKTMEKALRGSEERYRAITECARDAIITSDCNGNIRFWNTAAEKIFGYAADEVLGRNLLDVIVPPQYHEAKRNGMAGFARTGHGAAIGKTLELTALRKDGTEFPIENSVSAYRDEEGFVGVALIRDITERKWAEGELAKAQKLESIGHLAAGIAHEINTPTQYIGDNTHFLQEGFEDIHKLLGTFQRLLRAAKDDTVTDDLIAEVEAAVREADIDFLADEIPKAIEQSLDGVARVAGIVRAMKEFSHPGSDLKQAMDLNRAIETTLTVSRNEWKYVAELVTDFDPNLPPVPCLSGDLNQVVLNLVVNAAQAIGEVVGDGSDGKGTITVRTRLDGDWAEIRVEDTGTGIPEEIRSKVFDHFFTTKEVGKGSGQGLTIAHSIIVRKHGGTIRFETETGRGTTFIIRLPITDQPRSEDGSQLEKTEAVC
jgi:PAS domain S-box-containing protein